LRGGDGIEPAIQERWLGECEWMPQGDWSAQICHELDQRALLPTEEFAIDGIRVDAQGRLFHGDLKDVKNWFGYGADILAAGAGRWSR
jgi:hypothetical protein